MQIGTRSFPISINPGRLASGVRQGLQESLRRTIGQAPRDGFVMPRRGGSTQGAATSLPRPPAGLAASGPGLPNGAWGQSSPELDALLGNIKDPEQKALFKLQQEMQRQNMLFSMLTNLEQISSTRPAVQNLRV